MTLTQEIASYALSISKDTILDATEKIATEIMRDCVGCILGGMNDWPVRRAAEYYRGFRADTNASVIGIKNLKLAPEYTAMINAMAAHIRDFDDICVAAEGHPTVAVFPSVLALGEALSSSGREIIDAYIAGVEITGLMGSALFASGYHMGWDTTCTAGIFGTTAAAAKLLKLTEEEFTNALGIAATEASGLRASYGTFAKDLTAGRTASKGIYAAKMAQLGFDANPAELEDESGLLAVASNGFDVELFHRIMEERISTFLSPGMIMKRYPSCRGTHNAIDAALELVQDSEFRTEEIKEIFCYAEHSAIENDRYPQPEIPIQGKFSIPYCVALALKNKGVRLGDFSGDQITDKATMDLCRKISVTENGKGFTEGKGGTKIVVVMNDGARHVRCVDIAKGDPHLRLTEDELESKFMEIAEMVMDPIDAKRLYEFLGDISSIKDAGEIVRNINQNL